VAVRARQLPDELESVGIRIELRPPGKMAPVLLLRPEEILMGDVSSRPDSIAPPKGARRGSVARCACSWTVLKDRRTRSGKLSEGRGPGIASKIIPELFQPLIEVLVTRIDRARQADDGRAMVGQDPRMIEVYRGLLETAAVAHQHEGGEEAR